MVNSGKFRHRLEIQQLTETAGEFNQPGESYSIWKAGWWVRLRPITGRELEIAGATHAERTHVIEMRYCLGLTDKHRFKWREPKASRIRYFNIVAILTPEEIKEEMHVQCLEDVSKQEAA